MRRAETYCPIDDRIRASQHAELSKKKKKRKRKNKEEQWEQKREGAESDPSIPFSSFSSSAPYSEFISPPPLSHHPPTTLSVSPSLRLCSRVERSQLLRGLQCYAIAQAERRGGGGRRGRRGVSGRRGAGSAGALNSNNKQSGTQL